MQLSDIHICIRSYKRAGIVKTIHIFPSAAIWVPESQGDDYRKYYDNVVTIPDKEDGTTSKKFNAILNRTPSDYTLILDDDIPMIGMWNGGEGIILTPEQALYMVWQGFVLAEDLGVELWGINQGYDPMWYRTYTPFSLLAPVLGPFNAHIRPTLRYDDSCNAKEDYDFWFQNIQKIRKTLRLNMYHYKHDIANMPGGLHSIRTNAYEDAAEKRMKEKWGHLYRAGGTIGGKNAKGVNKLNSILKCPIPGC